MRFPPGQYGAGTVEIWDRGTYELVEQKHDGGLTVRLHGARAKGLWTLVPASLDGNPKNWLLLSKTDTAPARGYTPMLASAAGTVPQGEGWVYEPKWDGFRVIATIAGGRPTLRSRNGNDLTERFSVVAEALPEAVRSPNAVLDGEVCALDADGTSRFGLLQSGGGLLVYVVFDVLEADGEPLVELTLEQRRERLDGLVAAGPHILVSPWFTDGPALLAAAQTQGLEGLVAKRRGSRYRPGLRSPEWVKVKLRERQEFVVVGWTSGEGRRSGAFGALMLAVNDSGRLRYVGNVGSGFAEADLDQLRQLLASLERGDTPLAEVPRVPRVSARNLHWVEPSLVVEVEFAEWTTDGRLRAPVFLGLRDDRAPESVVRESQRLAGGAGGSPPRAADLEALEPRQAVLAGRGDHEGRPARVLPRGRGERGSSPPRPAVHDEAVPRRLAGEELLPEEHAEACAGLAPHGAVPRDVT